MGDRAHFLYFIPVMLLTACSGIGDNLSVPTSSPATQDQTTGFSSFGDPTGGHNPLGFYMLRFRQDEMIVEPVPVRSPLAHLNVTSMIKPPKCGNCLEIAVYDWDTNECRVRAGVTVRNPLIKYGGYDIRVIMDARIDGYYVTNPDSFYPDGLTELWNVWGETRNPFMAMAKDVPNRYFGPKTEHSCDVDFYYPKPPGSINLSSDVLITVDACYPSNCPEPYEIKELELETTEPGLQASFDVSCYINSWLGDTGGATASIEEKGSTEPLSLITLTSIGGTFYQGEMHLGDQIGPGSYRLWVKTWSSTYPSIPMYQMREIEVIDNQGKERPEFIQYPPFSGIATVPFEGPAPELKTGDFQVTYSLAYGPDGVVIDPVTGVPTWPDPIEGANFIGIKAENTYGEDTVEFIFRVVANLLPGAVIYSTEYFDFILPAVYAEDIEEWHRDEYLDAWWDHNVEIIGQTPTDGRQILQYDPSIEGWAWSGNPSKSGPWWWNEDPVALWGNGAVEHEVIHNFHACTFIAKITGDNWADKFYHHMDIFTEWPSRLRALENLEAFHLYGESLTNFQAYMQGTLNSYEDRGKPYVDWLAGGGKAENYEGDASGAWYWITVQLTDSFGPGILEDMMRSVRTDGFPASFYDSVDSPLKKNTLLFCILSCAAGEDLRQFFVDWGFDVDNTFYAQILPTVQTTISQLPEEDHGGWKQSQINDHWYTITPWAVTCTTAERMAQRLGGHLATIRSQNENDWIFTRFRGRWNCMFNGYTDRQVEGVWRWMSGETPLYTNWHPGEPNNAGNEDYCVQGWNGWEDWVDVNDETRQYGVIELNGPPG